MKDYKSYTSKVEQAHGLSTLLVQMAAYATVAYILAFSLVH